MVAGNVIIGRRDEGEKDGRGEYEPVGEGEGRRSGESDGVRGEGREGEVLVGGLGESVDLDDLERRKKDEDVLELDSEERQEARDDLQLL